MKITDELKAKLLAAQSAGEVTALLEAEGREISPEDAARIWEGLEARREDGRKLSLDELDAVSGGNRDWVKEGCAATVEAGSDCWGTDACDWVLVEYDYFNPEQKCPNYPGMHKDELVSRQTGTVLGVPTYTATYRCIYCGRTYHGGGVDQTPVGPGPFIVD